MMWHAGISKAGAVLQGMVGWVAAGAAASILGMGIALWYVTGQLSQARERLATASAEIRQCVHANETAVATITALTEAAEQNAALRDAAIAAQREAVERIRKLEGIDREPEIIRIRQAADGDDCAGADLPDALRLRLALPGSD